MEVLVFKTSIAAPGHIKAIKPHLNSLSGVTNWNFDLEDIDKILRIMGTNISASEVESKIRQAGYYCEELKD